MIANRNAFGETILELAQQDERVVVVDSDASSCMGLGPFIEKFPERHFECGIAEQNMIGVAAGLSTCGLTVFCGTFAVFAGSRALDQVRNAVCYNHFNVKIAGTHAGVETGPDGGTHQALEDIAVFRSLPGIRLFVPATPLSTRALTRIMYGEYGPFYIRMGREPMPELYDEKAHFRLGGSNVLKQGSDAAILACGNMVCVALEAAQALEKRGVKARVVDMYCLKPIDEEAIVSAAKETGHIFTVEDHSVIGGLGGAVSEVLADRFPARVTRIGIPDVFGRSGTVRELNEHFGLTSDAIVKKVLEIG
ncbi:MAG: transketolase family protein [Christensenellales bacterium]|jgi:transketolase